MYHVSWSIYQIRFVTGQILSTYTTLFVAVAPHIFKGIANTSGNALNISQAEAVALQVCLVLIHCNSSFDFEYPTHL